MRFLKWEVIITFTSMRKCQREQCHAAGAVYLNPSDGWHIPKREGWCWAVKNSTAGEKSPSLSRPEGTRVV